MGGLGVADREEILVGLGVGECLSEIARRIGRVASVATCEVATNGGETPIGRGVPGRELGLPPGN